MIFHIAFNLGPLYQYVKESELYDKANIYDKYSTATKSVNIEKMGSEAMGSTGANPMDIDEQQSPSNDDLSPND